MSVTLHLPVCYLVDNLRGEVIHVCMAHHIIRYSTNFVCPTSPRPTTTTILGFTLLLLVFVAVTFLARWHLLFCFITKARGIQAGDKGRRQILLFYSIELE